ncbi:MAG: formate dehydrogenase subunit gamma [Kiloniellales bacterium]
MSVAVVVALGLALSAGVPQGALAQTGQPTVAQESPTGGTAPGQALGSDSSSEMWRAVREGIQGSVSIPDQKAGVLIQSEGDNWRAMRNGPLTVAGGWIILGFIGLVALFFLLRGRIKIEAGPSGRTIERFNTVERFAHWLTAVTFVILALTGLNILYGKHLLLPLLGPSLFADLTLAGKYAHNYLAFPFMLGVVLMFVLWVRHNIPNRYDMAWIAKGGGLFTKGVHPPSKKFNAGQKLIFWVVVLGGLSLSLTGLALLFPFTFVMWDPTFAALSAVGIGVPTGVTPMEEMQLSQLWHGFLSLIMIGIIIAHIYIGSLGMEGAFAAMGSGQVDENWAREHHNVWVAEVKGEQLPDIDSHGGGSAQPAE